MRTLRQGFPPQCLIGVDRPRCKWLNLNFTSGRIPRVPRQARGCQGSPWSAIRPENISTQIKPAGSVQPAGFSFQHTKRMLPWNRNLGSGVSLIVAEFHTGKWTLWGAYWQDGGLADMSDDKSHKTGDYDTRIESVTQGFEIKGKDVICSVCQVSAL